MKLSVFTCSGCGVDDSDCVLVAESSNKPNRCPFDDNDRYDGQWKELANAETEPTPQT